LKESAVQKQVLQNSGGEKPGKETKKKEEGEKETKGDSFLKDMERWEGTSETTKELGKKRGLRKQELQYHGQPGLERKRSKDKI